MNKEAKKYFLKNQIRQILQIKQNFFENYKDLFSLKKVFHYQHKFALHTKRKRGVTSSEKNNATIFKDRFVNITKSLNILVWNPETKLEII